MLEWRVQGAADAAYETAWLLEYCTLHKLPFSGGAADIYRCFDQLSRPLIYDLIKAAGMPKRIAEPYQRFLEGLMVHNSLGGSLGEAYSKPTSIPLGDPFSRMILAFITRPWIRHMRSYGVQPRVLADDLQVISTGIRRLEHFELAFAKTQQALKRYGSQNSPHEIFHVCVEQHIKKMVKGASMGKIGKENTASDRHARPGSPPKHRSK